MTILAIGRLGRCPEASLVHGYAERASAVGRSLGLGPVDVAEIEPRKAGKAAEGEALLAAVGAIDRSGRHLIACDEHGAAGGSRAFAQALGSLRDQGVRRTVFLVGGADGLSDAALQAGEARLSFGPQTWPHALARVMLAEQIYRAATLLAGGPYHRD